MKIAFLIPDNRDEFGWYDRPEPVFGPAPDVLLRGFSELVQETGCEIHVVSCSRKPSAHQFAGYSHLSGSRHGNSGSEKTPMSSR